jgi:hypothetical protein
MESKALRVSQSDLKKHMEQMSVVQEVEVNNHPTVKVCDMCET